MPPKKQTPARKRVARAPTAAEKRAAIEASGGTEQGKVMKVLYLDEKGKAVGEWSSAQMPEDPFGGVNIQGLQEPPYSLEQLVYLAEAHPVHSAALEQKAVDVCGTGWEWDFIEGEDEDGKVLEAEPTDQAALEQWFNALAPDDEDMQEVLLAVWNDVETVGWGAMEITRDPQGIARRVYHVPGHTVRAHRDGFRLVQVRGDKKVWFRRWGAVDMEGKRVEVHVGTGAMRNVPTDKLANDLFVVKRKSRRSSWYGIPGYISAIGWLTLALAARDDNLLFFQNRREPRWAIILTNLADDPDLEEDLRRAFTVDLKQPHRNILVPITGPGKVDFQKLTDNKTQDGSFEKLADRADKAILIGHRIPGERLANTTVGSLGGNLAVEVNRVYKEGYVSPAQELFDSRLNKFIKVEYEIATESPPKFKIKLDDLDIETERDELDLTIAAFKADLITLGEARHRLKLEPIMEVERGTEDGEPTGEEKPSPFNDMLYTQLPGVAKGGGPAPGEELDLSDLAAARSEDLTLALLHADVREMLVEGQATHARLVELANAAEDQAARRTE